MEINSGKFFKEAIHEVTVQACVYNLLELRMNAKQKLKSVRHTIQKRGKMKCKKSLKIFWQQGNKIEVDQKE